MPSPLAHVTGFLIGLVEPIQLGIKVVLQDHWDPIVAAQLIQDERLTTTVSATPFLADLTKTPAVRNYDLSSLIRFHCGGAPIPRALVQQAWEEMQMTVTSCWGMSEVCLVTTTTADDPPEKSIQTDGRAVLGMEVRIVDAMDQPVPTGEEGRLQARCHSMFVGYLKRPDAYNVDAEGWFETGDLARMDEEGYIRITGRSKDIIIRGGENIPVVEVEQLLYHHPAVADAAIVAMPDERLGERGCCFITLQDGQQFTFNEMQAYLREQHMSRSYLPERLEIIPEMPRTPSGKIQKFKLREMARELAVPAAAV
jgi:cyclohexanecarboxylate-CoA ligase